jgi:hypothetical protein
VYREQAVGDQPLLVTLPEQHTPAGVPAAGIDAEDEHRIWSDRRAWRSAMNRGHRRYDRVAV